MLAEGIAGLEQRRAPLAVIGSGPVALAFATQIAAAGIPVLVLESGGKRRDKRIQELSDADVVDPARHDDMRIAVARRLGGTSNLWGARCLPYDPVDFRERDFVDARWPINYSDLAPYWQRAVAATRSGAAVYVDDGLPHRLDVADNAFAVDRLERWANVQAAQDVHREAIRRSPLIELRTHVSAVDLRFAEDGRVEAVALAHSLSGERTWLSVDNLVIAAGGIETARLLLAARRDAPERFGGEDGPLGRYYMGHAMGEIADVVFHNPESARSFKFMVDRYGSYVRRRIVPSDQLQLEHGLLNSAFWPLVPAIADARHGSAILSTAYLAIASDRFGGLVVPDAIRVRHIPKQSVSLRPHLANVLSDLPGSIGFAAGYLRKRYARKTRLPAFFIENRANRYGLGFHSEQVPQKDSRVWLSQKTDRLGLPRLVIDLRFSFQDVDSLLRTHDLLERWMVGARLGRIEYHTAREDRHASLNSQLAHGTHQIGLTRMGANRREGVVDADLRCFDAPNLYLASSGVLPTSGQANPTLTAIALSIRLADHLKQRMASPTDVRASIAR